MSYSRQQTADANWAEIIAKFNATLPKGARFPEQHAEMNRRPPDRNQRGSNDDEAMRDELNEVYAGLVRGGRK